MAGVKDLLPLKTNARDRLETHQLLVVGIPPFGKGFAAAVAAHRDEQFRRRVTVTDTLPLKKEDDTRASIDFVCFVASMQSRLSLEKVRESLQAIVPEEQGFLVMGRWALVVLNSSDPSRFALTLDDVNGFAKSNELPVLFGGSLDDAKAMDFLAGRVATLLRRAARENGVSPLFGMASSSRPDV